MLSQVDQTPPFFADYSKREKITVALISLVVFGVLGSLAILYHTPLLGFFKQHLTVTAMVLPAGVCGMGLAALLQYSSKKIEILLVSLLTLLVVYIVLGNVIGLETLNGSLGKIGIAFAIGLSGFWILNSRQPRIEKEGEIFPHHGFNVVTDEPPQEVFWEVSDTFLPDRVNGKINTITADSPEPGFVYYSKHYQGENGELKCRWVMRSIAIMSHKRPVLDNNGRPTGEHHVLLYNVMPDEKHHYVKMALPAALFYPVRFAGGVIYNVLRIVPLIAFIFVKAIYDLARKKETLSCDFLWKRLFDIHKVVGDSFRNCIKNILAILPSLFLAIVLFFEALFRKSEYQWSRRLISELEHWVNDAPLHKSFWSVEGWQKHYKWEGTICCLEHACLEDLGKHGFWVMGCASASALGTLNKEGRLISVAPLDDQKNKRWFGTRAITA